MFELQKLPLLLIFAISLVLILGVTEIGHRISGKKPEEDHFGGATVYPSMLGLLALMIGFTFAMSLARHDARRDAALNEANSIGTVALRARLLPSPQATESLKLLREYVQIRLDVTRSDPTKAQLEAATKKSAALHEALWQYAKSAASKDNALVPTGLFIQSLNEMIDLQEKRLAAFYGNVPEIVVGALYLIATISAFFTGLAAGDKNRFSRVPTYIMGFLVVTVILLIQDLDRPRSGFIKTSQRSMTETFNTLSAYPQ